MYLSRITKEARETVKLKDKNFVLTFDETNILNWTAYIFGPADSPYKDGIFEVSIVLNSNYPLQAPKMTFKTRIFHPNVHFETGEIWFIYKNYISNNYKNSTKLV
jgi:peroxin-4